MKRYLLYFLVLLFLTGCGASAPGDSYEYNPGASEDASEPTEAVEPATVPDVMEPVGSSDISAGIYPEPGIASAPAESAFTPEESAEPVGEFTVVVENQCDESIHGIGFEFTLNGISTGSVLCTVQDGGWIETGGEMEQEFDEELLGTALISQFTAKVFVVSAGSAQFCLSDPIDIAPEDGETYTYALTGNEQEGYWIE